MRAKAYLLERELATIISLKAMVDIFGTLPSVAPTNPSTLRLIRNKLTTEQTNLPLIFSTNNNNCRQDYATGISDTKRWTGHGLDEISHPFNVSDVSHRIHRKFIDHELDQCYSTTTNDTTVSYQIKQHAQQKNSIKQPLRVAIGTGATATSIPIVSNVDDHNSCLFNVLSKHFTIRAEPLRPTNYFVNDTSNIKFLWKNYRISSNIQKRR